MINKLFNYSFLLIFAVIINSCNKESIEPEKSLDSGSYIAPDTDYDKSVANVAFAVHQSLNDNLFCITLKNKIMLRPDGDYEVILKSFVKNNRELSKSALFTSLLNNELTSKGGDDQVVLEKYPNLQIAIPINAEKWDGSSKLWILYLPSDYDDVTTKEVPAISPNGERTLFNVEKQPDFPVIVVGLNERSNKNGDLKYEFNMFREEVKFNSLALHSKDGDGFNSFSATPVTNAMAVNLSWTFTYPYYLEPYDHYFEIYRDDLEGNGPQKIGEADSWQSFYYDSNVLSSKTYSYFVVVKVDIYQTYNRYEYQDYFFSNADEAALPQIPNFTNNFSVTCIGPSVMELRWTINNMSSWTNLKIKRYTDYNTTPVDIVDLPLTSIYYQDILSNPYPQYGVTYTYILNVSNVNTQEQQEYYCKEMLSNRINNQWLKVSRIQFNSFDDMRRYESWLNGAPEVMLSVNKVINGTAVSVLSNVEIGGPASSGFDVNYPFCQWQKSDANAYTISLNEYDGGEFGGIEISLATTIKVPEILGVELSTTFGVKTTLFKRNRDDFIGTGYLYYWNNADGRNVSCGPFCQATFLSVQE